jgi:hypothetical protein
MFLEQQASDQQQQSLSDMRFLENMSVECRVLVPKEHQEKW